MRIVAAAVKDSTDKIWSLPPPNRHHHIIKELYSRGAEADLDGQGFLLDDGRWIDRKTAAIIALSNDPNKVLIAPPNLYSEDLW